ncbi:hypothetical protein FSP39_006723 [Pinctada imbricata]|uniref:EF-hand domain-containing protein n=1 Tax=Pinctada imbricata TaxID=66713 RepID=A0AA89BWN2_PINIB|nr:hypothetical protein FSP39_006723 [Pinctada imbricata]
MITTILLLVTWTAGDTTGNTSLAGHLKPLGGHAKQLGGIPYMGHFPSPNVFYTEFVEEARPLVMSRALEVDDYPAYKLWTDVFLSNKFGDEVCEVDKGRKKSRNSVNMEFREFIQHYPTGDMLLFQEVPDPMKGHVMIPFCMECGGYVTGLKSVTMWLSNGGTKSYLHKDPLHNIVCQMDGSTSIFMMDKKHHEDIETNGWVVDGSYSTVDVDSVDMNAYPQFSNVPYYEVELNKGDCLFIPERMPFLDIFHGVPPLNYEKFKDLIQQKMPQPLSMTQLDVLSKLFTYIDADSSGEITWEELYSCDIEQIVEYLSEAFQDISVIYTPQEDVKLPKDMINNKQYIQDKDDNLQQNEELNKNQQSHSKQTIESNRNNVRKKVDTIHDREFVGDEDRTKLDGDLIDNSDKKRKKHKDVHSEL